MDSLIRGQHPVISGTGIRVIDIVIEYEYKGYVRTDNLSLRN